MKRTSPLQAVTDVDVEVSVQLAETVLPLEQILELRPGATLSFPSRPDRPLIIEVDGVPIGRGQAVERAGRLGCLVESLVTPVSGAPEERASPRDN